jgi:phosphatidylinositol-3,4,5-trisphosphate 3-phosphatase/dual-specificity protein phosphatase PTEN
MNWLRKKVSGKRNRFKDCNYDLDITYITGRILAMSFPASGMEICYRNKISKVANFLDERHEGHYKIFNLSNRTYNEEK